MTGPDRGVSGTPGDDAYPLPNRVARFKRWVLLDDSRYALTVGAVSVVSAVFLLFVRFGHVGVLDIGRSTTSMLYLFSGLIGGNITVITIGSPNVLRGSGRTFSGSPFARRRRAPVDEPPRMY